MAANATRRTGHNISVFSRREKGVGAREIGDERARRTREERVGEGSSTRAKKQEKKGEIAQQLLIFRNQKKG